VSRLRFLWVSPSGVPWPWAGLWFALRRGWRGFRFGWLIPRWVALGVKSRARWGSLPGAVRAVAGWAWAWVGPGLLGLLLLKGVTWLVALLSPLA